MTDITHVEFKDVCIRLRSYAGGYPYRARQKEVIKYTAWFKENLKKGTYRIYNNDRSIQLFPEDLVIFTLKFGKVYDIIPQEKRFSKVDELLIRTKYEDND